MHGMLPASWHHDAISRRPPLTVGLYVALYGVFFAAALLGAHPTALLVVTLVLLAALLAWLWSGGRVAWAVFVLLDLSVIVTAPFSAPDWVALGCAVVGLALLLAPSTRGYMRGPRARRRAPRATAANATAGS
jgi:hypothetical protein